MTIHIGPISSFVVHFGEVTTAEVPKPLCVKGGDKWRPGLSTFTTDRDKVTCPGCLEWLHA